jgi:hypothetical protein
MYSRPLVGLILLRAAWFDKVVALPGLAEAIQQDAATLMSAFPPELDLVQTWVVNSASSLATCEANLRTSDFDLVVLAFQVWAEDYFLNSLVDVLHGQPLAVWCYQPSFQPPHPASFRDVLRFSGPVGTLEGLGTLKNLKIPYAFCIGAPGSQTLNAALVKEARAGQVRRRLHHARIGLLPARNEQMQSTFVDEFRLRADLGPVVEYLSVVELQSATNLVSQTELDSYIENLQHSYPVHGVRPETLRQAARASLGLYHLSFNHHLDLLSLNDISDELHTIMGLRPCFYPPAAAEAGILMGLEGDLGAATAMLVFSQFTDSPLFFTEFWFWDEAANLLVGGHAGIQDPRMGRPGEIYISQDYEYEHTDRLEGAHFQFACRPGRVTLFQLRCTCDGWQALICIGEIVDLPAWIEGYPHAILHPDCPVLSFFEQGAEAGTTQHWILAYGDTRPSLQAWCKLANVKLKEIL